MAEVGRIQTAQYGDASKEDFDYGELPVGWSGEEESHNEKEQLVGDPNSRGQFDADKPCRFFRDLLDCCGTLDCNFCRCSNCSEFLGCFFSCTNYELAFIGFLWLVILGIVRQYIGEGGDAQSPYNLTKISGSAVVLAAILIYAIPKWIYKYIYKPCCCREEAEVEPEPRPQLLHGTSRESVDSKESTDTKESDLDEL